MAYSKTTWVNGVTPLNQSNMNKIENELESLDQNKQDTITAGSGITKSGSTISVDTSSIATKDFVNTGLATKQGTLTAGTGVTITSANVISVDTTDLVTSEHLEEVVETLEGEIGEKQDTITDLEDIREGAELGATALQGTDVINNVQSSTINKPLSANMGKELQDQINNLSAIGRFLSGWDCATGLPQTDPISGLPYEYQAGDYYIVKNVATPDYNNYRPNGLVYTGQASTTPEEEEVNVNDYYRFDGALWLHESNTQRVVTFGNISGQPSDNLNLASALNGKQATIDSSNKLSASLVSGLSSVATSGSYNDLSNKPTIPSGTQLVSSTDRTNWNSKQSALSTAQLNAVNSGITSSIVGRTLLTPVSAPTEVVGVGVDSSNAQVQIKFGKGLESTSTTSPYTYDVKGVEYKSGNVIQTSPLRFERLTQAQYDALSTKDANTLYIIVG